MEDPIAGLENAYNDAQQREIFESIDRVAARIGRYRSSLIDQGIPPELASEMALSYHVVLVEYPNQPPVIVSG